MCVIQELLIKIVLKGLWVVVLHSAITDCANIPLCAKFNSWTFGLLDRHPMPRRIFADVSVCFVNEETI